MGYWGTQLYANDTTRDVRDFYIDLLRSQCSKEEAYEKTTEKFKEYIGDIEEPLFWYALADSQWRAGRLNEEVKTKALYYISNEGGIEIFEESPRAVAGWKKTIQKLKDKLESPQPREKRFRPPEILVQDTWNLYDVYAYQLTPASIEQVRFSGKGDYYGKYMVLQKVRSEMRYVFQVGNKVNYESQMIFHAFNKVFDTLPSIEDIVGTKILPMAYPARSDIAPLFIPTLADRNREYPVNQLTFLGNPGKPLNIVSQRSPNSYTSSVYWLFMGSSLLSFYLAWRDVPYEVDENGEFDWVREDSDAWKKRQSEIFDE